MSTRCTINFCYDTKKKLKKGEPRPIEAKIYRHYDGYPDGPDGVRAALKKFFAEVKADTEDTRFNDPTYLAAKFVVWQAALNAQKYNDATQEYEPGKRFDFTGVGVCMVDPGDIDYTYHVLCSENRNVQPKVLGKKVHQSF
jgi:hypothetical protein